MSPWLFLVPAAAALVFLSGNRAPVAAASPDLPGSGLLACEELLLVLGNLEQHWIELQADDAAREDETCAAWHAWNDARTEALSKGCIVPASEVPDEECAA